MIISHNSPTAVPRINSSRKKDIHSGFNWSGKGVMFDTDPDSISLIWARVGKICALRQLGIPDKTYSWMSADNVQVTFTTAEFLEFAVALDDWVESKYVDSWAKKATL